MTLLLRFLLISLPIALSASWETEFIRNQTSAPLPWMEEQIQEDLAPFASTKISEVQEVYEEEVARGNPLLLVLYSFRDGEIVITSSFEHPRIRQLKKAFQKLHRLVPLPNIDILISMDDEIDRARLSVPALAFAKNPRTSQGIVLMPDFESLHGNLRFMKEVKKGREKWPWKKKKEVAIFRGATTGRWFTAEDFSSLARSQLIAHSFKSPADIDARYTILCQTEEPEKVEAAYSSYFGDRIPVDEHLAYKYQILIDGNSSAYSRAYWQLFSGCPIFKVSSPAVQWFYKALEENKHYIPVAADSSDLLEKIQWARSHDRQVKKIAKRARSFAKKNLTQARVMQYLSLLFKRYSELCAIDRTPSSEPNRRSTTCHKAEWVTE